LLVLFSIFIVVFTQTTHNTILNPQHELHNAAVRLDAAEFSSYLSNLVQERRNKGLENMLPSQSSSVSDSFVQTGSENAVKIRVKAMEHSQLRSRVRARTFPRCQKLLNTWLGKCVFGDPPTTKK